MSSLSKAEAEIAAEKKTEKSQTLRVIVEFSIALMFFSALSTALTWPAMIHPSEILLGGGELGGWLWRHWWHFEEVKALYHEDVGFLSSLEAMIGLGRFPETGNILDVLLLSYPLRIWVGFPADHNFKIFIILIGNGLSAYALARSFTDSPYVALGVSCMAIINPLVIQDINKLGLRQVTLWWLFLFPIFLNRAGRTGSVFDSILSGILFTLCAAFYWFYGLFAGMFAGMWFVHWVWKDKPPRSIMIRFLSFTGTTAMIGCMFFLLPYFSAGSQGDGGRGGSEALPELTFLLPYPAYDTIASAPQRPTNYQENVLSSLHRGIDSSWPADFIIDPRHGVLAFPAVVFILGVLPAFFQKRARFWMLVWFVFWLGALGPFLKIGAQKDTSEVFQIGEYVVRLPYCFMFQWIPGMSRMFAPYRLASMMIVASVALSAISLNVYSGRFRTWVALLFGTATVLQPFYRFDLENEELQPEMWRIPTQVSGMQLPQWYEDLDPTGWEGIIEMPLEQQQDLLCAYQSFHQRKVYRSWATTPAVPPWIRDSGGGAFGKRLRWLAKEPPREDPVRDFMTDLSREPSNVDFAEFDKEGLLMLMNRGSYRWLVVHERGYYLVNPNEGSVLYRDVVRRFEEFLNIEAEQLIDQENFEWPGKTRQFPVGPAWVPWASQEVQRPVQDMPDRYFMAVFDLYSWKEWHQSDYYDSERF